MEKNANGKLKHGCSQGRGLVGPFFLEGGGRRSKSWRRGTSRRRRRKMRRRRRRKRRMRRSRRRSIRWREEGSVGLLEGLIMIVGGMSNL